MLVTKEVKIKVNTSQLKHFKNIGVDVVANQEITIPIEQLPEGSHLYVECKCDICGKIKKNQYRRYLKSINNGGYYSCSTKCALEKTKNAFVEKYGVEHHFKTEETKQKMRDTLIKNYGVDHFAHSKKYKDKVVGIKTKRLNTINEKYISQESNILSITDDEFVCYCPEHKGEYSISKKLYHNRKRIISNVCLICYPYNENRSIKEKELLNLIKLNYVGDIIPNFRLNNREIDVYLPNLNIGFEFNGSYWHNEKNKPNDYHKEKSDYFEENGIQLIHVWEYDWVYKQEIVKSRVLNLLGKSEKIFGRKCSIKEISSKEYKNFNIDNHIQGYVPTKIKLGLIYENEIVAVMGFGPLRKNLGYKNIKDHYELLRFSNKINTSVIGGSSKLFNYFINNYNPEVIISYADRSWSIGNMYKKLNFEYVSKTSPNYSYTKNNIKYNRYNFRKDVLIKKGYDKNKSEKQIMIELGYDRIYDSGSLKFIWRK